MVALGVGGLFCNGIKRIELSDAQQRLPVPAGSARRDEKCRAADAPGGMGAALADRRSEVPTSCLPAAETVGGNEL